MPFAISQARRTSSSVGIADTAVYSGVFVGHVTPRLCRTYNCASASATRAITASQSPRWVWRKSRMLGYQGVVSPSELGQLESAGLADLCDASKRSSSATARLPCPDSRNHNLS